MKRDMDLVRQILIAFEDHEHGYAPKRFPIPEGFTEEQVGYHLTLMGEAGLIEVSDVSTFGSKSPQALPVRLTWEGHEFIANARNETVWAKVTAAVISKGGSVSFEVLKFMVIETAKSYFLPVQPPALPPAP
jgi:hypothetical protein